MAVVTSIHIAPGSRLPLKLVDTVFAEAGKGLVGDRYHGTKHRHVSIQSLEDLAEAGEVFGDEIRPGGTRRNITLSEGRVPTKPGTTARIGNVNLEVVRIAAPCRLLDDVIGPGANDALRNRAGTIFRVISSGEIRVGDAVNFEEIAGD